MHNKNVKGIMTPDLMGFDVEVRAAKVHVA